jgi:glutamyl-tRNA synthetase
MAEKSESPTIRTRIAPSPTGEDIHIGNLYTALINYAVAKKHNGSFVIRIEDTDRERFVKDAEQKILQSIKAYGLSYDEGPDTGGPYEPYRQSERLKTYIDHATMLIEKERAYYCFCAKERLDELRNKQQKEKQVPRYDKHCLVHVPLAEAKKRVRDGQAHVIRLNVEHGKKIAFDDLVRGTIEFDSNQIDDQVLIKSDGYPTYHMGVVVDDYLMKISHIIRAEEWISSTPKHIILYEAFGWKKPIFAHLPILRNPDRSKLSKRKNPVWATWYIKSGFLPEAVLNFLALMGWSHPEQKEIFSLSEFIAAFDLHDIKPVGPIFDLVKLKWMNQQYIQALDNAELLEKLKTFYSDDTDVQQILADKKNIDSLLTLAKTRMETLQDFKDLVIHTPYTLSEKEKQIAKDLYDAFTQLDEWTAESILSASKSVLEKHAIKMSVLYRILTGKERGLPLPETLALAGKEETLKNLTV